MMSRRINPGELCRLHFAALDTDGNPITDLAQANITAVSWETVTDGVASGIVGQSITLVGSTADPSTTALTIGQLIDINSNDGIYAIDAPSTAAAATADIAHLVITLDAGTAYSVDHPISKKLASQDTATSIHSAVISIIPKLPTEAW